MIVTPSSLTLAAKPGAGWVSVCEIQTHKHLQALLVAKVRRASLGFSQLLSSSSHTSEPW